MKSIILSVKPYEAMNILNGEQKIIIKKTAPKETPFKVYLCCTKVRSNSRLYKEANMDGYFLDREGWRGGDYEKRYLSGKVVAEFVVRNIENFSEWQHDYPSLLRHIDLYAGTKGDYALLDNYLKGKKKGYAWRITDLKIYDEPKELDSFTGVCKTSKRCGESKICSSSQKCLYDILTKPPATWMYVKER